jgi:pantoate--beta-alanine ligase
VIELATISEMRAWSRRARAGGRRIALVPTMGCLHEGHLRLVDEARARADEVVMSIFVNPLQFGPSDDLDRYPRVLARDRELAAARGVTCLFVPTVAEMYPAPAVVRVSPGALGDHLCGPFRPGHFEGVLTVVAKLLHASEPDIAVFGRKDAQQARMIGQMAADLDFPVTVVVTPTVRAADGLAMSSRNTYLTPEERQVAARIPIALARAHTAYRAGLRDPAQLLGTVRRELTDGGLAVEYVEAVDPDRLAPVPTLAPGTLLAVAARIGHTRLIDNIILGGGPGADITVAD